MKLVCALIVLWLSLTAVEAAQNTGGGSGGLGFSCDADTLECTCKGDSEGADCKAMAKNCETGGWDHCLGATCYCKMKPAISTPASSANTRPMAASPGIDELRRVCSPAGGSFSTDRDGGYSCVALNCDGKGGHCQIACDNTKKCRAGMPSTIDGGMTLLGILQNGDMVLHEQQGGATGQSLSTQGGGAATSTSGGKQPSSGFDPSLTIY